MPWNKCTVEDCDEMTGTDLCWRHDVNHPSKKITLTKLDFASDINKRYHFESMSKVQESVSYLTKRMQEAQEQVFKQALRDHLKREPTVEDARECTLGYCVDRPGEYTLYYKGTTLGLIKYESPKYWDISMRDQHYKATGSFSLIFEPHVQSTK